jgi:hypothetical protein
MMYEQFKTRAEGVSAEVCRFETKDATLAWLIEFLHLEGMEDTPQANALWAECSFLDGMDRHALQGVAGLKFEVTRELASEARFGISQMEWALADTGSLAQNSTAIEQRLYHSYRYRADKWDTAGHARTAFQGSAQRLCLSRHDYRAEQNGRYRAGADYRGAWAGTVGYHFCR